MDIASILIILALVVLVLLFISQPFFSGKPVSKKTEKNSQEQQHSALLAERDRILTALQELEFDQALGKIPAEDYPAERSGLLMAGAEIYRKLDEMEQTASAISAEERLEAAVASRRADAAVQKAGAPGRPDDLEAMIAARRGRQSEKAAGFCPACGAPVQKSDKFCPRCGKTV
jgi:hypothetical protein